MVAYPSLKVVKAILQSRGLAPRKRLGQNFLIEANVARKSLQLAEIASGDTVVEIGPGLGALTQLLLEAGCTVYAIEMDSGFFRYLETELVTAYKQSLHLMHGDAMDHPLAGLSVGQNDFKIVANLPYAISTPWLDAVLSGPLPSHMVLMLQKEAAKRFIADPGSGNYSPISLFLKSVYHASAIHNVGAQCFYPKPEVGSALLSLERMEDPILFSAEIKSGVRQIFTQRRKQISSIMARNTLGPKFQKWLKELIDLGLAPETRPEVISQKQWQLLSKND